MPRVKMEDAARTDTTGEGITDRMLLAQVISPNERYTATLLGLIVMQAGIRESTYKRGKAVDTKFQEGTPSPFLRNEDVVGTIGRDMIHSGELNEMRDLRNHLFHGVKSVNSSSGSLVLTGSRDPKCTDSCKFYSGNTEAEYTVEELESWAVRFILLDPVVRADYVSELICVKCGLSFECICRDVLDG